MTAPHPSQDNVGFYERLLERLALALDTADTALRLRHEVSVDLELRGLSDAEMRVIDAYPFYDKSWLEQPLPLLEPKKL